MKQYYDIYDLLMEGYDLAQGVAYAGRFTRYALHSKNIYSILLNDNYFYKPADFALLEPKYDVSTKEIADFIKHYISKNSIKA